MLLVSLAGEADQLSRLTFSADLSWAVTKADHLIGLADVEIIAAERHSKWKIQSIGEDETLTGAAVAFVRAQDGDAPGARLGDEDVPIGRLRHPARATQISAEFGDHKSRRQMQSGVGRLLFYGRRIFG